VSVHPHSTPTFLFFFLYFFFWFFFLTSPLPPQFVTYVYL
jgi:hypothetical protein